MKLSDKLQFVAAGKEDEAKTRGDYAARCAASL